MAYLRRVSNIPCGMAFLREFSSWIADFFVCVSQEFFSVEREGGGGGRVNFDFTNFEFAYLGKFWPLGMSRTVLVYNSTARDLG